MKQGKVKFYNEQKGFGFIIDEAGKDVFVHATGLKGSYKPKENDEVNFVESDGKKGKNAIEVELA